jgi:hypothetical protein
MHASALQCALTGRAGYRQAAGGSESSACRQNFETGGILLMKINSPGERLRFVTATTALSIAVAAIAASALLGVCVLIAQSAEAAPASRASQERAALEVLVFSSRSTSQAHPGGEPNGEALTLRFDSTHGVMLPRELSLYEVKGTTMKAAAGFVGAPPADAVVAVYSKWGPRVLASNVPGTSPAPEVAGKSLLHYRLIVLSNPSPDSERQYNDWYDHQHVPDVLRVPGFKAGQRLKLIGHSPSNPELPRYAVNFEFDSADLEATIAEVKQRLKSGVTRSSPAFDVASSINRYYEIAPGNPP